MSTTKEKASISKLLLAVRVQKSAQLARRAKGQRPTPRPTKPFFPTGGVYLKKSEQTLLTGSAGGIPPEPPFRPPRQKAEAEKLFYNFH